MTERLRTLLSDKGKRTALDLMAGIVVYDLLAIAVGGILRKFFEFNYFTYAMGTLLGMAVAIFMTFHMYHVLEQAVLCDAKRAKTKTKLGALLRMFVMAGALAAGALLPKAFSVIGVFSGIFALKIAALTQPLIDRFFSKFVKKED
jgi:hypothetical protein